MSDDRRDHPGTLQSRRRRGFLAGALGGGAALLVGRGALAKKPDAKHAAKKQEPVAEEVSPVEDLMREHGVLRRVLLVYEEVRRRLGASEEVPAEVLPAAAGIVRRFIEDYHEKNEEQHVFPRLEKAGKLVELVAVLRVQHDRGRALTAEVLQLGTPAAMKHDADRRKLEAVIDAFGLMYRAHAAREDTVLFPTFKTVIGRADYDALGERFEEIEKQRFGEDGFEKAVAEVGRLEESLGIADLAHYTPKA